MKNFFKKLSFVLAIAMVLTSLAPATASAAAKNYVAVNGKKATATYAYIGGKEVVLTPYVNGKKATKVTIENSNPEKATIDNNGVITPVANGNTIVTFKKGDKKIGTVTVKVRTRAKALNIYDRAEYKAGNKTKLTELTLKVGDKKDLQITMPLYKVSKKAGAVKASYFTYPEVSDSSVVKVTKNAGQRNFTVEALAAGTAKVTIVANQKTEKNVRADKYYKEASFDVTVKDEKLTAEQTGAQKITVTGTDLTDKVADYVVKRGTVELSLSSVELSEDKATAVLVAAASTMPKGDYTVKFGELEAQFTVETPVVKEIVVDPEDKAILDKTDKKVAYAYYKVVNQFGEDVTAGTLGSKVTVSGSNDAAKLKAGVVKFTNSVDFTMNLSQVSLALVCTENGVNTTKVLTVSDESKLASVELFGVYTYDNGKYVPVSESKTLKEGNDSSDLAGTYLLFAGKDQYGHAFTDDATKLTVNTLSTTGLKATAVASIDFDGDGYADKLAFELSVDSNYTNGLGAGKVQIMTVCLNNGAQTSDEIEVLPLTKIDTLTISEKDGVFGGQANELAYEAIDTNGNAVTDFATLEALNAKWAPAGNLAAANPKFVRKPDGSAKLMYTAASNSSTVNAPAVITFLSDTNKFTTANISVQPNCVATAVVGIKDGVVLGTVDGGSLAIKRTDLKIQDQYGHIMADSATAQNARLAFATVCAIVVGNNDLAVTTANAVGADATLVATTSAIATTKSTTIKVFIEGVEGSDYTFKVYNVAIDDLKNFEVGNLNYVQHANSTFDLENISTAQPWAPEGHVFGYYNGVKVQLQAADYVVFNHATNSHTVSAPAIASSEGKVEKEGTFTVRINNKYASEITKTFKYSNKDSAYKFDDSYFQTQVGKVDVNATVATDAAVVLAGVVSVADQYGEDYTGDVYYSFTSFPKTAVVTNNGKTTATIKFTAAGEYAVDVKYTLADGTSFTNKVVFRAE